MFSMNLNKLKVNEAELKAYIYQQLADIEPFVGGHPVSIKMSYNEEDMFEVKINASNEAGEIEVLGVDNDVYSALSNAKYELLKNLHTFNVVDDEDSDEPAEREEQISNILAGSRNNIH